jgi:iron-sulfur cluster assembly accessory protein|tara:strand:+ start:294 stop:665 length:372 start_codon:yes stop_codon:yes gene_type:complete
MTVSEFDPNQSTPAVHVTAPAIAHLRAQIERSGRRHLRLGVKESGCNGYMYTLDYVDAPEPSDRAFEVDPAVTVYVSEADLPLVRGTEVDYVTEGLNASLRFRNANASTYCGCGESFAVASAD